MSSCHFGYRKALPYAPSATSSPLIPPFTFQVPVTHRVRITEYHIKRSSTSTIHQQQQQQRRPHCHRLSPQHTLPQPPSPQQDSTLSIIISVSLCPHPPTAHSSSADAVLTQTRETNFWNLIYFTNTQILHGTYSGPVPHLCCCC